MGLLAKQGCRDVSGPTRKVHKSDQSYTRQVEKIDRTCEDCTECGVAKLLAMALERIDELETVVIQWEKWGGTKVPKR